MANRITARLLHSVEPAVRYKVFVDLLDHDSQSPEAKQRRQAIKTSPRAQLLLSERVEDGTIPFHPYTKWCGAHWVLASLADLGYPPGDETLIPLREQVCQWLLSKHHERSDHPGSGQALRLPGGERPLCHADPQPG